jgi:hypothetical protein
LKSVCEYHTAVQSIHREWPRLRDPIQFISELRCHHRKPPTRSFSKFIYSNVEGFLPSPVAKHGHKAHETILDYCRRMVVMDGVIENTTIVPLNIFHKTLVWKPSSIESIPSNQIIKSVFQMHQTSISSLWLGLKIGANSRWTILLLWIDWPCYS